MEGTPESMLRAMVAMQEEHGREVAPIWKAAGFPFHRAVWMECAEALEAFRRRGAAPTKRAEGLFRLEVVDVWHFGLCDLMARGEDAFALRAFDPPPPPEMEFERAATVMAERALILPFFAPGAFAGMLQAASMSAEDLLRLSAGKHALSLFRLRNGAKQGAYDPRWSGAGDNVALLAAMQGVSAGSARELAYRVLGRLEAFQAGTEPLPEGGGDAQPAPEEPPAHGWEVCARLMDALGWKWWRLQPSDWDGVRANLESLHGLIDGPPPEVQPPSIEAARLAVDRMARCSLRGMPLPTEAFGAVRALLKAQGLDLRAPAPGAPREGPAKPAAEPQPR